MGIPDARLIREAMAPFAEQHGFRFRTRTLLVRVREDTLHIVCFEVMPGHYYCNVAIQPLYVPATHIALGLGDRLEKMGVHGSIDWGFGETEEKVRQELVRVRRLLEKHALPWFARVGTPSGIVRFLDMWRVGRALPPGLDLLWFLLKLPWSARTRLPNFDRFLYLGFSHLYVGQYEAAQRALAVVPEVLRGDTRPSAIEYAQLAERMRLLARDRPERVPATLEEIVRQTKASLRLEKVGL
ncbi:MAG: hypothetical protein QME94_18325 [Anaerolineae bacterium]|nr:hypothetical protein [Anaerolineae bacterium]